MIVKRMLCVILAVLVLSFSACESRDLNGHTDAETGMTDSVYEPITQSMPPETIRTEPASHEPQQTETATASTEPLTTEPVDRDTAEESETDRPIPAVTAETTPPQTEPAVIRTEPPVVTPVVPAPVQTQPTPPKETEPQQTAPAVTERSTETEAPPIQTEPAITEPIPTQPAVTEPIPTEPAVTEPIPTQPAVTEPIQTEPSVTEPPAVDPASAEFAVISPSGEWMVRFEVVSDDSTAANGAQYRASVIDAASGSVTVTALTSLYQPEAHWSPDSRYVGISYRRDADTATIILDAVNGRELVPPHGDLSRQIFGALNRDMEGQCFYRFAAVPESWHENFIRVTFEGQTFPEWIEGQVGGVVGFYTFDLRTLSIAECAYLPYYNLTTLPPPDDDMEQTIQNRLLLIAGDGSSRNTEALIAQNSDAYSEILAFGNAALIYLREVICTDHGPYDPSQEYLYAVKDIANAAISEIGG